LIIALKPGVRGGMRFIIGILGGIGALRPSGFGGTSKTEER